MEKAPRQYKRRISQTAYRTPVSLCVPPPPPTPVCRVPGSLTCNPFWVPPHSPKPQRWASSHTHITDVAAASWGSDVPCSGSPVSTGPRPGCNPGLSCLPRDNTAHLRVPGALLSWRGAWVEGGGWTRAWGVSWWGGGTWLSSFVHVQPDAMSVRGRVGPESPPHLL